MIPAAVLAISQFWLEAKAAEMFGLESWLTYLPSIFNALIVAIFSGQFEVLSNWLTNMENHRTQAQYERHRYYIIMFLLINCYYDFL